MSPLIAVPEAHMQGKSLKTRYVLPVLVVGTEQRHHGPRVDQDHDRRFRRAWSDFRTFSPVCSERSAGRPLAIPMTSFQES